MNATSSPCIAMAQAARTPVDRNGSSHSPVGEDVGVPRLRIDVALVDNLLALLARRQVVTRQEVILFAVAASRASYYDAEGFVTDVLQWSGHAGEDQIDGLAVVDALLDLRVSLMVGMSAVDDTAGAPVSLLPSADASGI